MFNNLAKIVKGIFRKAHFVLAIIHNNPDGGVRKIKVKQKISGCFRTDNGANDFAKLHSIVETASKNGNSKYNAILAVVQQQGDSLCL